MNLRPIQNKRLEKYLLKIIAQEEVRTNIKDIDIEERLLSIISKVAIEVMNIEEAGTSVENSYELLNIIEVNDEVIIIVFK